MRKLFYLSAAVAMTLAVTACGGNKSAGNDSAASGQTQEQADSIARADSLARLDSIAKADSMAKADSAAKADSGYQNISRIHAFDQIRIIILHAVFCHFTVFYNTGITCRIHLVCIDIITDASCFSLNKHYSITSCGCVIRPVSALAAATAGLDR